MSCLASRGRREREVGSMPGGRVLDCAAENNVIPSIRRRPKRFIVKLLFRDVRLARQKRKRENTDNEPQGGEDQPKPKESSKIHPGDAGHDDIPEWSRQVAELIADTQG